MILNDPRRVYSDQRAEQEWRQCPHHGPPFHPRRHLQPHLRRPHASKPAEFADTCLKAGVNRPVSCYRDTDLPNADDMVTLRIKGAVAMN
jgi:hypothetical protein